MMAKQCLLYHGGTVFEQAENDPSRLATSVLGLMIKCLLGGPTFLFKIIPVKEMPASFLYEQIDQTTNLLRGADAQITPIIVDRNRTNQNFFKHFNTVVNKPWLTVDGIFLLNDFVHLLKSIRNNWLTEKTGKIAFEEMRKHSFPSQILSGCMKQNIANLSGVRGLSKLIEVAVSCIERKKENGLGKTR